MEAGQTRADLPARLPFDFWDPSGFSHALPEVLAGFPAQLFWIRVLRVLSIFCWVRAPAGMRSRFLSGARRLWARRAISRTPPPSEELLARGGPLRAFLERRVGSEAGRLDAGSPQLAAAARLLSEKERELRDTESLLHGKPPVLVDSEAICVPDLVTRVLIILPRAL